MLVLARKAGEEIVIDGTIRMRIVEIRGNRARLAFSAPPQVSIHRAEVYRRIMGEETLDVSHHLHCPSQHDSQIV